MRYVAAGRDGSRAQSTDVNLVRLGRAPARVLENAERTDISGTASVPQSRHLELVCAGWCRMIAYANDGSLRNMPRTLCATPSMQAEGKRSDRPLQPAYRNMQPRHRSRRVRIATPETANLEDYKRELQRLKSDNDAKELQVTR